MATSGAKSDYLENKVLVDNLSGTVYLALFTSNPTEAATGGTEVSGGGYSRKTVSFTITGDTASNSAIVNFGQASANWGTVTHWALFTASTGGNKLWYGATENGSGTNTGFAVNNGDTFSVPIGAITITED